MTRSRSLTDLDPQRICIVKPSAFGCVIQSLPLIDAVRRRFSAASISWVIRDDLRELLTGHPHLAECLIYERRGGPGAFLRLLRQLQSRRFDVVIDLQGLLRSGVMTLATRAPVRIGLESAREGAAFAYNRIIGGTSRHVPAADRYWRVAEALGTGAGARRTSIFVPERDRTWAQAQLNRLPRPIIAVHAGAMWETKRCPPELFAALLSLARARFGGSYILVGTANEAPAAARIQSLLQAHRSRLMPASSQDLSLPPAGGDYADLVGATNLKQLTALLSDVDVLLCNDSGPMHLAAAVGTPVVGLFTCTSPTISGPRGTQHQLLSADVPCVARYHKSCPLGGKLRLRCHTAFPVDRIGQALARILEAAAQESALNANTELAAPEVHPSEMRHDGSRSFHTRELWEEKDQMVA